MSQKRGKATVAGIVGTLAVLALTASAIVLSADIPLSGASAAAPSAQSAQTHTVGQTLVSSYCPSQISVAADASSKNSGFAQSQGDLASSSQYAAVGNVYGATLGEFGKSAASALTVNGSGSSASILSQSTAAAAHVFQTTVISPADGTGALASTASWASTGDVRGLASTSCVQARSTARFLVPSTKAGTTNTLTLANPSDKPTVVSVQAWGASGSGPMRLGTGAQTAVAAHSTAAVDVNAAAANQDAAFLTVTSSVEPVYSIVKSTAADGLTPKGVEDVPALTEPQSTAVLPGLRGGEGVILRTFADKAATVKVSWLTESGMNPAKTFTQKADRVMNIGLGAAPAKAHALLIEASAPIEASASAVSNGEGGQSDFAILSAAASVPLAGAATVDGTSGAIVVANPGSTSQKVSLTGIDSHGAAVGAHDVEVGAHSAQSIDVAQAVPGAKVVKLSQGKDGSVAWALSESVDSLAKAKVAGTAVVMPTSLMAQSSQVTAVRTPLASVQ